MSRHRRMAICGILTISPYHIPLSSFQRLFKATQPGPVRLVLVVASERSGKIRLDLLEQSLNGVGIVPSPPTAGNRELILRPSLCSLPYSSKDVNVVLASQIKPHKRYNPY